MRNLAFSFVVALWSSAALAHPPYDWIRQHSYVSEDGISCCGKNDCRCISQDRYTLLPDGSALVRTKGGIVVKVSKQAVFRSEDWCARYCDMGCLFTAPESF